MTNIRVYELSKELGVSNKEIIETAGLVGISLRSHASSVSSDEANKIKDKLKTTRNHGQLHAQEELKETKEEVKVFRSESGEEVVERRKGSTVIRRKKKVEETEADETSVSEQETKESIQTVTQQSDSLHTGLKKPEVLEKPPLADLQEQSQPQFHNEHNVLSSEGLEIELSKSDDKAITAGSEQIKEKLTVTNEGSKDLITEKEDQKEADAKGLKKKVKKVKPKREEIIDEETLEELRRAFRTKLPARKREYLVEDRRSRTKSSTDTVCFKKSSDYSSKRHSFKSEGVQVRESESGQVIQFPTKIQK
ncbi:MAG: translation initiation factor IF-2 N-terminal domain-containing protein, partial [Thermodesulfobacteriota bacterium]